MQRGLQNNSVSSRLLKLFLMDKKKGIVALCLISVMLFMWIKVFVAGGPEKAEAALLKAEAALKLPEVERKLVYIDMPEIKGRNDVLSRDFFDVDARSLIGTEVDIVFSDEKDLALVLAEGLKLEAIALGQNRQAFINDKLLAVGDKFFVSDEDEVDMYECEVIGIEENKVFIRCGETEISLKLVEAEVVN